MWGFRAAWVSGFRVGTLNPKPKTPAAKLELTDIGVGTSSVPNT